MKVLKREDWIAALRDPNNHQVDSYLKTPDGYCCLGLGLEVAGCKSSPTSTYANVGRIQVFKFGNAESFPTAEQLQTLGISHELADALAVFNDSGVTFADIANFLETGVLTPAMDLILGANAGRAERRAVADYRLSLTTGVRVM